MNFPYIVIDQNVMRRPNILKEIVNRCTQGGFQILIPEGAFFEFFNVSSPVITWTRSLRDLAPYRKMICVSRKLSEMLESEKNQGTPCTELVSHELTGFFRSKLFKFDQVNESFLQTKIEDEELQLLVSQSKKAWSDHPQSKVYLQKIHDELKRVIEKERLKNLRKSKNGLEELLSEVGTAFIIQGLQAKGFNSFAAIHLAKQPSVSAGFLSCFAALAGYWLLFGGLSGTKPGESTNDFLDMEYALLGALSQGLETLDKRPKKICQAVSAGFQARMLSVPEVIKSQ